MGRAGFRNSGRITKDDTGVWSIRQYIAGMKRTSDSFIVDASISQASRPEKQIAIPPVFAARVTREFRRGNKAQEFTIGTGVLAHYEPLPNGNNKVWKNAPDWIDKSRHVASVEKILAAMGTAY